MEKKLVEQKRRERLQHFVFEERLYSALIGFEMWLLWIFLFLSYLGATWFSLIQSTKPVIPCRSDGVDQPCFRPVVAPLQAMTLELWLYHHDINETSGVYRWNSIESCRLNFTIPESGFLPLHLTKNDTCEVAIPNFARQRSRRKEDVKILKARFMFRLPNKRVAAVAPFDLTRVNHRHGKTVASNQAARNLLESPIGKDSAVAKELDSMMWIPYLKYGRSPIRIRIVSEYRNYGYLQRNDGLQLQAYNQSTYRPIVYVDDLSLPHSSEFELGPPEDDKPPLKLHIKLGSISPFLDVLNQQVQIGFSTMESMIPPEDLDEVRHMLQDERLYRFVLTQVISYVHVWFDYLAFKDEIGFYRGKGNMTGVSTSTVVTRFLCSFIILLYLLDGGGTSWVVLLSLISSCSIEAWKVWRLVNPTVSWAFPFISLRQNRSSQEVETAEYDRIATKNLAMILYPLVVGWSIYALQHYEYKSWYSWLISNLANAVYTFGFISLCPQLYVNYRLKSVAHLPWKVFMYKVFNTFVDDAFAWLIEMPWKHRIMTLRDDVVFLLFLVQVYLYKVDKTRVNEFGYVFEEPVGALKEKEE
eukprot:scaffold2599_cov125-Cylindrotheca_fusiformis.AAC.6